jgi:hypothetical protein
MANLVAYQNYLQNPPTLSKVVCVMCNFARSHAAADARAFNTKPNLTMYGEQTNTRGSGEADQLASYAPGVDHTNGCQEQSSLAGTENFSYALKERWFVGRAY